MSNQNFRVIPSMSMFAHACSLQKQTKLFLINLLSIAIAYGKIITGHHTVVIWTKSN